jgi:MarR-like DNA-binding transcriptional regulator SgrR of sgrS sRNA
MPEHIYIRVPGANFDSETVLLKDSWPNMIETSSMINADILDTYHAGDYHVWKRPFDKMGVFRLNPSRSNATSYELFKYLRKSLNRKNLFQNLSGYETTVQAFPKGYPLYDPKFACDDSGAKLPDEFKRRPIQILLSPARINRVLRQNIIDEIERLTDIAPTIISVNLQDLEKSRKLDNYDFYAGTVGMADPEPEGIMSYYFEGNLPTVPPSNENFVHKLDLARKEQNREIRIQKMIAIMTEATCKGHVLPLYHVSTVGIGRPELDFSNVPLTDESITLSKIRFKIVK